MRHIKIFEEFETESSEIVEDVRDICLELEEPLVLKYYSVYEVHKDKDII